MKHHCPGNGDGVLCMELIPTSMRRCAKCERERRQAKNARREAMGMTGARWQRIRRAVLERDGHICQSCHGYGNSVHIPPELRGQHQFVSEEDCVTLCSHCHGAIDGARGTKQ